MAEIFDLGIGAQRPCTRPGDTNRKVRRLEFALLMMDPSPSPGNDLRVIFTLPPGASASLVKGEPAASAIPLWLQWASISQRHARLARKGQLPDSLIDLLADDLGGVDTLQQRNQFAKSEYAELSESLVAIVAAAHAVDGFYGSVTELIGTQSKRAKRPRKILESLKRGFEIGAEAERYRTELDWLFTCRDKAVHHSENYREVVTVRTTSTTRVLGAPEALDFSADAAERAAALAVDLIATCLDRPKALTQQWATQRQKAFKSMPQWASDP